jgi:hypothetical protein
MRTTQNIRGGSTETSLPVLKVRNFKLQESSSREQQADQTQEILVEINKAMVPGASKVGRKGR